MSTANGNETLRLDYGQTTDLLRTLTDVRFKLLAIVPTISGAAVAFLSRGVSAARAARRRPDRARRDARSRALRGAEHAAVRLRDPSREGPRGAARRRLDLRRLGPGGLFTERPGRDVRVFGLALAGHERGLAIVYGAALAGWSYLVAWGALRALDVGSAQKIGGIVGIVVGVLALSSSCGSTSARPEKRVAGIEPA